MMKWEIWVNTAYSLVFGVFPFSFSHNLADVIVSYREEKAKVSVQVEIGTMELPPDQSILKIVAEGIPRQCQDYPTAALDGEQFRLTLWDGSGEYQVQIWEPYTRTNDFGPWIEVIDAIRGAGGLVSREFVAV